MNAYDLLEEMGWCWYVTPISPFVAEPVVVLVAWSGFDVIVVKARLRRAWELMGEEIAERHRRMVGGM